MDRRGTAIDEDKAAARLSEQIAADTAGVLIGDHRTAGVIAIATADFTTPGVAEITMMIAADHRGVGVGSTLLDISSTSASTTTPTKRP
ncbi:hypothetical protein ACQP2U_23400 [Nocardia sp. CA-084685]|uniref:hypothetical protein n=1 Tax=Nocardia sp. CA-084685 TaxID=3239970 RepID=UPI003D966AC2